MERILKQYGLSIAVAFACVLFVSQAAFAQPFSCIPTCDEVDGKMLVLAQGATLQTINNQDVEVGFISVGPDIEIGIFDGDDLQEFVGFFNFTHWDLTEIRPPVVLEYRLILDPGGTGAGNGVIYKTWSSNGTFGDNVGEAMPDNDWFVQVLPNVPEARNASGTYSYRLEVSIFNPDPNPAGEAWNAFKIRSDGVTTILAGSAFNYIVPFDNFLDFITIYPNIDFFDTSCVAGVDVLPGGWCDPTDPNCCLHDTTYDGRYEFCMLVPSGLNTLDIWDGDLDYGSASFDQIVNLPATCIVPDNVSLDTDDLNTPIALPPWSIGTDVVQQGVSVPTAPPDDFGCRRDTVRPPSIQYELVSPDGNRYTNVNPSGNLEWELFNISTNPPDPLLYDINVPDIPGGLWCIQVYGNDMRNLNSLRLPYDMFGVDERGNPVTPGILAAVPTFSEWGMLVVAILLGTVGFAAIRKRQATT